MDNLELTKLMVEKAKVVIEEPASSYQLARARVIIGLVETKGWTIAKSNKEYTDLHILPPRVPKTKYFIVYLNDPDLFASLKGKIASAYRKSIRSGPI